MKNIKKYHFETVDFIYYIFAFLRIILTLVLQRGYIHPDEFFQSIEIMAGKISLSQNILIVKCFLFQLLQGIFSMLNPIDHGSLIQRTPYAAYLHPIS